MKKERQAACPLAAQALEDPARLRDARTALVAWITDHTQLDQLHDDSLCHGWAGVIHTSRRVLADTDYAPALTRLEYHWTQRQHRAELSDLHGMLTGSAGLALTALPDTTRWDTCLLATRG